MDVCGTGRLHKVRRREELCGLSGGRKGGGKIRGPRGRKSSREGTNKVRKGTNKEKNREFPGFLFFPTGAGSVWRTQDAHIEAACNNGDRALLPAGMFPDRLPHTVLLTRNSLTPELPHTERNAAVTGDEH